MRTRKIGYVGGGRGAKLDDKVGMKAGVFPGYLYTG